MANSCGCVNWCLLNVVRYRGTVAQATSRAAHANGTRPISAMASASFRPAHTKHTPICLECDPGGTWDVNRADQSHKHLGLKRDAFGGAPFASAYSDSGTLGVDQETVEVGLAL